MYRHCPAFGDIDRLSVLHVVQEVPAELVHRNNSAVIPHLGKNDSGSTEGINVIYRKHRKGAIPWAAAHSNIMPPVVDPIASGRHRTFPPNGLLI